MASFICVVFLSITLAVTAANAKRYKEWHEDFEGANMVLGGQWPGSLDHPELTEIVKTTRNGQETKAMKVKYLANKFGKESRVRYKVYLEEHEAYVLEFDVKFEKGFDFSRGGKLPGLCSSTCTTGCKNITAEGWSSRFLWKGGNHLTLYTYDQDRTARCGTVNYLGYDIVPGRWTRLKQEIRLNSPNAYDGTARVWIDGAMVYERRNLRWRGDTQGGKVGLFAFTTFFGGSTRDWSPSKDCYTYFDNMRVYRP
eukprot:gene9514-10502_t